MPSRPQRPGKSTSRRPAGKAERSSGGTSKSKRDGKPKSGGAGRPSRSGGRPEGFGTRATKVAEGRGGRIPTAAPEDSATVESDDSIRLQKFLAMAGVDSRRNCEEYIRTGRVTVDGEVVVDPARAVDPKSSDVRLDSERLRPPRFRYFLINKPKGFLCTNSDPQGRPRAIDLVPVQDQRLFTVGRLDESTEGLLLITNDGDLAEHLAHPRFEVIRRYRCHVAGVPETETLRQLREGMYFSDGYFRFRSVHVHRRRGRSVILELELQEGKNREIRRLMARVGHKVLALERIGFGPLQLRGLGPGRHRELLPWEIQELRRFAEHGEQAHEQRSQRKDGFGYRSGQTRRAAPKPGLTGVGARTASTSPNVTPDAAEGIEPREVTPRAPGQGPRTRAAGSNAVGSKAPGSGTTGARSTGSKPSVSKPSGSRSTGSRVFRRPENSREEIVIEVDGKDARGNSLSRRTAGLRGTAGRRSTERPKVSADRRASSKRSAEGDRPDARPDVRRSDVRRKGRERQGGEVVSRPQAESTFSSKGSVKPSGKTTGKASSKAKGKAGGKKSFRASGKSDKAVSVPKGRDRRRNK